MLEADNSRHNILKRIRAGLGNPVSVSKEPDLKSEVFKPFKDQDLTINFAESFLKTKGTFFFCENGEALKDQLKKVLAKKNLKNICVNEPKIKRLIEASDIEHQYVDVKEAQAGLTFCEVLVARTGSVILSSNNGGRTASVFPPVHIIFAETSQIVKTIEEGLLLVENKYPKNFPSLVSLVSGPSRTADIEKTLVLGAHGPKELILFLLDDTLSQKAS